MRVEQLHRTSHRAHATVVPTRDSDQVGAALIRARRTLEARLGALHGGIATVIVSHCADCALLTIRELHLHRHLEDQVARHPDTATLVAIVARTIVPAGLTKGQG